MDREKLAEELLSTFENINTENIINRLKLSVKGENAVLFLLHEHGGISTPGKLSEHIDFTAARLSAIIKSLESKGLVERNRNSEDKRSTTVILTAEGYRQFIKLRDEIVRNALTIIEQLGENDVREFLRIVKRLLDITSTCAE